MMKKFTAMAIIFIIFTFILTACSNDNSSLTPTEISDTSLSISVDFDEISLTSAYCNNTWDGSFISNNIHCASIDDNGNLWIDCKIVSQIPDLGIYEDCSSDVIIESNSIGTWIYDREISSVELWEKGHRLKKLAIDSDFPYSTTVYKLDNKIVAHCGQYLNIYNLDPDINYVVKLYDIIDSYKIENSVVYSTFDHENFKITSNSEENEQLDTNYVRFPRENSSLVENGSIALLQEVSDLYYNSTWDGTFQKFNSDYVYVDDNGNIIVNNKLIGNVSVGNYTVSTANSPNLTLSKEYSYWLNGEELIVFENGSIFNTIDIPDGRSQLLYTSDSCIVAVVYGDNSNTLLVIKGTDVDIISTNVIDSYVAIDTLYYMIGNDVYYIDLTDSNLKSTIFFEGAYAISQFDKFPGAIVPKDDSNSMAYGYENIYINYK